MRLASLTAAALAVGALFLLVAARGARAAEGELKAEADAGAAAGAESGAAATEPSHAPEGGHGGGGPQVREGRAFCISSSARRRGSYQKAMAYGSEWFIRGFW